MLFTTHQPGARKLRGLTLVEVLISALILSVGVVGLAQLYLASIAFSMKTRHLAIATQRAQREIEYITTFPYADFRTDALATHYPSSRYPGVQVVDTDSATGSGKTVSFTTDELPSGTGVVAITPYKTGYTHLLQVRVTVGWKGWHDQHESVTLNTLVADNTAQPTDIINKIKVTPANVSLINGDTQQFAAVVEGVTDPIITWKAERVAVDGTKTLVNAISSSGLFTAPMPEGAFHVTATTTILGETYSAVAIVTTSDNPHIAVLNARNASGEITCGKKDTITIKTQLFDVALGDGETLTFEITGITGNLDPIFFTSTNSNRATPRKLVITPYTRLNDVMLKVDNSANTGTISFMVYGKDLSGDPVNSGTIVVRVQ